MPRTRVDEWPAPVAEAPEAAEERRLGRRTWRFTLPRVAAVASIAGPFEGKGPLGRLFDEVTDDDLLGERSWERAECRYIVRSVELALRKAGLERGDVDLLFGGDLLNQIISSSFAARRLDIPYFGLYAACASFTEGLALASMAVDAGYARTCVVAVGSHHDAAERQYRFPTEFGTQRPPTAQWTATGGAAAVVTARGQGPRIRGATAGRVVDMGVSSPYDMGGAMAPAAADTLDCHFREADRSPDDYDLIQTGDLGAVGVPLCERLLADRGREVRLADCGVDLYDRRRQDVHAGGSGAACSALVFAADVWKRLDRREVDDVLFCSTGALHSPTTVQQGDTIPGVCHAIWLRADPGDRPAEDEGGGAD